VIPNIARPCPLRIKQELVTWVERLEKDFLIITRNIVKYY